MKNSKWYKIAVKAKRRPEFKNIKITDSDGNSKNGNIYISGLKSRKQMRDFADEIAILGDDESLQIMTLPEWDGPNDSYVTVSIMKEHKISNRILEVAGLNNEKIRTKKHH